MRKIDIVYCWVDNTDKNWVIKKNSFSEKQVLETDSNNTCRYNNNDELKYALRSLKHAEWINNIFIVTDNQCPQWLNTDNKKINVIDHKDIIPNEFLPTFNSNTILHNIVNIPGLSEFFLYSDDDMYFAKDVNPDFFFTEEGYPICRFTKPIEKLRESQYRQMLYNAINLLEKHNYHNFLHYSPHHNIDGYRKSIIQSCQNEFKDEIFVTFKNRFRASNDIERILYNYYAISTNQGIYKRVSKFDKALPLYDRIFHYITKNYLKDSQYFTHFSEDIEHIISLYKLKLFCINDTETTTNDKREEVKNILDKLYPDKSPFEK